MPGHFKSTLCYQDVPGLLEPDTARVVEQADLLGGRGQSLKHLPLRMACGQKQFLAMQYRRVEGVFVGAEADGVICEVDRPVAAENRKTFLEKSRIIEQRTAVSVPVQLADVVVLSGAPPSDAARGVNRVARFWLQC